MLVLRALFRKFSINIIIHYKKIYKAYTIILILVCNNFICVICKILKTNNLRLKKVYRYFIKIADVYKYEWLSQQKNILYILKRIFDVQI